MDKGLLEATQFSSLWATKDATRVTKTKVFWVLMEVSLHMAINQKPWFSPNVFEKLSKYAEFKADFHHVHIRPWKNPQ